MPHLLADEDGMTIYIGCPDQLDGEDGNRVLSAFYADLLGWHRYDAYGDFFLTRSSKFRLGFSDSGWSDVRPPRWPDPDYPQQAHLDILVADADASGTRVTGGGARLLQDGDQYRIYVILPAIPSASTRTRPKLRAARSWPASARIPTPESGLSGATAR